MKSIITKAKAAALVFMTYLMRWPKSFKDGRSLREGGFYFFYFLSICYIIYFEYFRAVKVRPATLLIVKWNFWELSKRPVSKSSKVITIYIRSNRLQLYIIYDCILNKELIFRDLIFTIKDHWETLKSKRRKIANCFSLEFTIVIVCKFWPLMFLDDTPNTSFDMFSSSVTYFL